MNCHGGCARNAGLKRAIDRVPKRKVIDPPNKRPEATAQERHCAESESLDRIHGCSAPCLIHGVQPRST